MPNFETHITISAVGSALLTAYGTARFGWDGAIPSLAFFAGAAGGMVPDLDSNTSKPRRLAGALVGVSAAVGIAGFVTSSGPFLNRPWTWAPALGAAAAAFLLFNFAVMELVLKKHTRHRGLFHSLAVPFLYGGLLACLATPRGADTAIAVWLLGIFGVLSHLLLDAAKSLSLNPLKLATADLAASTRLWLATMAVTLAAFIRLTKI
ncbi:hypothetical protein C4J81_08260 [Deltaproteobacteria bacterium Smac51]|nr:hypothetical protein C4J81_08260 [Deltaproteobacteria bacterium Smac51]